MVSLPLSGHAGWLLLNGIPGHPAPLSDVEDSYSDGEMYPWQNQRAQELTS